MSTEIWRPTNPLDTQFAEVLGGSPPRRLNTPECEKCDFGAEYERFPRPLLIEWQSGSDLIGDFIEAVPSGRLIARRSVFKELARRFPEIEAGPIKMFQDPKLKRPKRITRRTKPRVWLPYTGPELVELLVPGGIPCSPRTTTYLYETCPACGREIRGLSGTERRSHRWDKEEQALVPVHEPRIPGQGVFIEKEALGGLALFRLEQFPHALLCTDELKRFVEEQKYTNIDFWEYGDVV